MALKAIASHAEYRRKQKAFGEKVRDYFVPRGFYRPIVSWPCAVHAAFRGFDRISHAQNLIPIMSALLPTLTHLLVAVSRVRMHKKA